MKRKNKNIITIILLGLMIISLVVTIIYAKKSVNNNQGNMSSMNDNDKQMPGNNEKPDSSNQGETQPDMPNDNQGSEIKPEMPNGENKNNISTIYYVLFSVENLIITILVIYLVMSSFNKKTLKETFINKDKIIIYVLGSIILTIGLTYLMSFLTTLNNKNNTGNNNFNPNQNNSNITYSASKEIMEFKKTIEVYH